MTIDPVELSKKLIRFPSETPANGAVFDFVEKILRDLGFVCQRIKAEGKDGQIIDNLYARYGKNAPLLGFAGHLDVVPSGEEQHWTHPPFSGHIEEGKLYGRGAADMKSGVAAFISAIADFLDRAPPFTFGSFMILLSGDEEASPSLGMVKILEEKADEVRQCGFCIMAEPTSTKHTGDMIKIGRRGSLTATLSVLGKQGHAAYPDRADNAAHLLISALDALLEKPIDQGSQFFSASAMQIVSLKTASHVSNIIPAEASAMLNIRYNDFQTAESLKDFVEKTIVKKLPKLKWRWDIISDSQSFITNSLSEMDHLVQACGEISASQPVFSTEGGTSDSRFIINYCPVIDFGLVGSTMHQYNESVKIEDIQALRKIYNLLIKKFFSIPT